MLISKMQLKYFLTFLLWNIHSCCGYRILGVIPFSARSHYVNNYPILKELADRGHDVTVITVFEEKDPGPNYHQVVVDKRLFWDVLGEEPDLFSLEKQSISGMLNLAWDAVYDTTETVLNSTSFQEFVRNDNSHFDLIFMEVFYQESMYMLAHKYKAPIVGICTFGYAHYIGDFMGNPTIIPYMTHEFLNFGKDLDPFECMWNFYASVYDLYWRENYIIPKHQKMAEKYFAHLPGPLPDLKDIQNNISMVFLNTHYSYDNPIPLVPGIIETGGAHIKPPKKLPAHIQKFLDEAEHGAIYFSFGSNIQSKNMPKEKFQVFVNVFRKLKERVIWKWEDEHFEDKPDNVMIGKWLPQSDILAHPKIKMFITHAGLLSIQEALYHGVPLVGFPFFGDQFRNIRKVVESGYGIQQLFSTLSEHTFSAAVNKMLTDKKYTEKAKELSTRFKDRPNSPLDIAIFWIEYVIRHKGAHFMKSPIANMTYLKYYMLDVVLYVVALLALLYLGVRKMMREFISMLTKKKPRHQKNKKRN